MKLSNQAIGVIMLALQKGLLEQTDVVGILKELNLVKHPDCKKWGSKNGELIVEKPPEIDINKVKSED